MTNTVVGHPAGDGPGLPLELHLPALLPDLGGRVGHGQVPTSGAGGGQEAHRDAQSDLRPQERPGGRQMHDRPAELAQEAQEAREMGSNGGDGAALDPDDDGPAGDGRRSQPPAGPAGDAEKGATGRPAD
jgi:hypothetical protein